MKHTKTKKLTLAIALLLGASCAFGATACDKETGSEPASVKVDEAGWTAAFEKTFESTNFTINVLSNSSQNGVDPQETSVLEQKENSLHYFADDVSYFKGTYSRKEYFVNVNGETVTDKTTETSGEGYYKYENTAYYQCGSGTDKENGTVVETLDWQVVDSQTYEEGYKEQAIKRNIWQQMYYSYSFNSSLREYYSQFTYTGGAYYYQRTEGDPSGNNGNYYNITRIWIKINADGYISYYKTETSSGYYPDEEPCKRNSVCEIRFSDFGKTGVPAMPAAVTTAIENYKTANNG